MASRYTRPINQVACGPVAGERARAPNAHIPHGDDDRIRGVYGAVMAAIIIAAAIGRTARTRAHGVYRYIVFAVYVQITDVFIIDKRCCEIDKGLINRLCLLNM